MDLVVLFRQLIERRNAVKPAALVREEMEKAIAAERVFWEDLRDLAYRAVREKDSFSPILCIIGMAIGMTARQGKFQVRVGKFIDFKRVDEGVANEIISYLGGEGYTIVRSFKAGKLSGFLVSWALN